ncbi:hypothetical protein HK105_205845 [Polyrhizophydium stewartii]|uniref:G protein-coupled receptor n=1 Tax=Polyrhizophydium stewartii TaxID=2732419 RepID=A0ABR4N5H7_9FUNG
MVWFFETNPVLEAAAGNLDLAVDYVALIAECASLALSLANCAYVAHKIRRSESRGLLVITLVVSAASAVLIASHLLLTYTLFIPAMLAISTWSLVIGQCLNLHVEIESLRIFVPQFRLVGVLRWASVAAFLALGVPVMLKGPVFVDVSAPGLIPSWYRFASLPWSVWSLSFDWFATTRIAVEVARLRRESLGMIQRQHDSSMHLQAPSAPACGPRRSVPDALAPHRELAKLSLRTYACIALFVAIDFVSIVCQTLYVLKATSADPVTRQTGFALIRISAGTCGFHVASLSLLMINISRMVSIKWQTDTDASSSISRIAFDAAAGGAGKDAKATKAHASHYDAPTIFIQNVVDAFANDAANASNSAAAAAAHEQKHGLFQNNPYLEGLLPPFTLEMQIFALFAEILGLLIGFGNCVFLAIKLRQTTSHKILGGLLVVSILVSTSILFHIILTYLISLVWTETDALGVFVPRFGASFATKLRWFQVGLHLMLATPNYLHGPYFVDSKTPGFFQRLYETTFALWSVWTVLFDLFAAARITVKVVSLSRISIESSSGAVSQAADRSGSQSLVKKKQKLGSSLFSRPRTDAERRRARFDFLVRRTYMFIAAFAIIDCIAGVCLFQSGRTWDNSDSLVSRVALAYVQVSLGLSGLHILAISALMHNVACIINMNKFDSTKSDVSGVVSMRRQHKSELAPGE